MTRSDPVLGDAPVTYFLIHIAMPNRPDLPPDAAPVEAPPNPSLDAAYPNDPIRPLANRVGNHVDQLLPA